MYTVEQFKADVIAECVALREHATKEELNILNSEVIYAWSDNSCIYGLLTGDCKSNRASQLIKSCVKTAVRFNLLRSSKTIYDQIITPTELSICINRVDFLAVTALEAYIMCSDADIPAIQSYLTGQTETLVL